MPITFEGDNDIIVYAFKKIIAYARIHQYIFLVQSIWWISSVIGSQSSLVIHIDNLRVRSESGVPSADIEISNNYPSQNWTDNNCYIPPNRVTRIQDSDSLNSEIESVSTTEDDIHNEVIKNCELFLKQSEQERKALGCTTRQATGIIKKRAMKEIKTFSTQTHGIEGSELRQRSAAGECLRCAWPKGRKRSHKTINCIRGIRLEKGIAPSPKK